MARTDLARGTAECRAEREPMIWLAAGVTDMRKGFDTLCAIVQETLLWPCAASGVVSLSSAQLSMLPEGIDWRRPVRTARPQFSV